MKNFRWERPLLTQLRGREGADQGRFLQLSKKISEQEASEIMREVLELPDIRDAEIIDDRSRVRVETKDNVFIDVMSTVVNIFRRVAGGCELSFAGFAYKD